MNSPTKYTRTAILLHWLIAIGLMGMLGLGFYMTRLGDDALSLKVELYQWHKSFGITLLVLTLARLAWRLFHPPPSANAPSLWQRRLARVGHIGLYGLTLIVPLAGWAMASASPFNIPTILFGLIEWPHLPPFDTLVDKQASEPLLKLVHKILAYLTALLALGHAGAAIRHHFILKDSTLMKMLPFLSRPSSGVHDA